MKKILLLNFTLLFFVQSWAKDFTLYSPDKNISAKIEVGKNVRYSITYRGVQYVKPSQLSLTFMDGKVLGLNGKFLKSNVQSVSRTVKPLYGISKEIRENYNQLILKFNDGYDIEFRAYNEGFAWRFVTRMNVDVLVKEEQAEYNFSDNYKTYFHPTLSESDYRIQKISDKDSMPNYSSMPVLVKPDDHINILLHESDVLDYPCMTLKSNGGNTLVGEHKMVPDKTEPGGYSNFNLIVKETEKYIAKTTGNRSFPWRIVAFTGNDKDILNNQLVYLLASENKLPDVSWIKPGKVAWDWWNALNLTGVPFKTGFNTETYKYYIDFAARNGIEYVNLDEGWSDQFDLMKVTDKLDMAEVVRYAKSKNVGLFLWCVWWTIDKQMIQALAQFEKWGIAGVKVDFMDRDDQVVVNFHERLLKEAAKRKILVNYHGAYHPTGMQRTYPNNINVEGVKGLEWNKFNPEGASPVTAVTIPFIRMFAGSMDYTPGAMSNYNKKEWKQINDRPMSQGTRCQQLAMYIAYFAPLQMISDAPTSYEKEPQFLKFLSQIPVTWDETYPLQSSVGEYVNVARKKDDVWYVAGMTNWDAREMDITLDFLNDNQSYDAEIYEDGVNADRIGSDYQTKKQSVKKGDIIHIKMAPGGGYAVKLIKQQVQKK